jgi:putative oxidoreductase
MITVSTTHKTRSYVLHIALWIVQAIVASMFMFAGLLKTLTPIVELSLMMPLAADSPVLIRFIGIMEVLGALGLILPSALKIAPRLTVWAAFGLTLTMVLGSLFHIVRDEISATPPTLILGLLSAFITWGRSGKAPIKASKRILRWDNGSIHK